MRKMAAMPIMASSAGPRPKREWSWVDLDRMVVVGFEVMDNDGHDNDDVGGMIMDRDGEIW